MDQNSRPDFPLIKWGGIIFIFVLLIVTSNIWLKRSIEGTTPAQSASGSRSNELNVAQQQSVVATSPEFPPAHSSDENIAATPQKEQPAAQEIIYEFPIQDKFLVQ